MDRKAVAAHYKRMSDEQLRHFATHEASGLEPDAVGILRQELVRRGTLLDPDAVIDVQRRQLSSEEFHRMVTCFREEPCPLCGTTRGLLNGARVHRSGRSEAVAGCKPCLEKELRSANQSSVGVGLVFRPEAALVTVSRNDAALRDLESGEPTEALREYVWLHRGEWAHLLK